MKCENIRELMSAYIDNEINEVDKAKFEKHIAQCPQCKEEYELLKDIVIECSEIDEVELPEDFREELHSKLMEAKAAKPSKLTAFVRKNRWASAAGAVAAVLVLAISLNSLGAPKDMNQAQGAQVAPTQPGTYGIMSDTAANQAPKQKEFGIANAQPAAPAPSLASPALTTADVQTKGLRKNEVAFSKAAPSGGGANPNQSFISADRSLEQTRKIIKNGNVSLKVTDVQARIDEITTLATQSGGYVESSYVDNIMQPDVTIMENGVRKQTTTMVANMTIKVPAERFEGSFQSIIAMGKVMNQNTSASDITSQYQDIEARVTNLKVQEKHLQEIMAKAKTVDETLKVETELNRVRTDIDMYTGDLKNWDKLVEYSTINISMTEVKEAELEKVDVPGVWQKAQKGFINTINNIARGLEKVFIFLVSALPYIIILGAGSLLAVLWIRRKNK